MMWLAKATGVSYIYVTLVKYGFRKASARFKKQCAFVLGVPVEMLFNDPSQDKTGTDG